jgi:esterase/lipase superfamily enzyme
VKLSPEPQREFGEPYKLDHISIDDSNFNSGEDDCIKIVRSSASQAENVFVLTHGYNNSFSDAISRASAFARDVDLSGLLVIWSWPSQGIRSAYLDDQKANAWSTSHFVSFFEKLLGDKPQKRIDFMAHSMGGHILLEFVSDADNATLSKIGSIIFAAPDVDREEFKAKESRVSGAFQTLYAFAWDWPLMMSKIVHRRPRAGENGDDMLLISQVESIDASIVGHSAIFEEPYVIEDLRRLMRHHQHAGLRGLIEKTRGLLKYWQLHQ